MPPAAERPLTAARYPDVEERARHVLLALVSTVRDAAGDCWVGAALGGSAGHGEASGAGEERFHLLAVVEAPLRDVPAVERKLRRAADATARSRHATSQLTVAARSSLPYLRPTLPCAELLGADHVVDGPHDLLAPARVASGLASADAMAGPEGAAPAEPPMAVALPPEEGLRLLVSAGSRLVEGERALARDPGRGGAARALRASEDADLALGAAVLVSEGCWVPGEKAREEALKRLMSGPGERPDGGRSPRGTPGGPGFRARMTWTRFHDVVEGHRRALYARMAPELVAEPGEARRRLAVSADRWLEVLRLFEEDRLGEPLPNWEVYARILAARRRNGRTAGLFDGGDESERPLPTRREARSWPLPERLGPAAAALVDWDPGDLEVAAILLDLPSDAARDALRQRLTSLAADL